MVNSFFVTYHMQLCLYFNNSNHIYFKVCCYDIVQQSLSIGNIACYIIDCAICNEHQWLNIVKLIEMKIGIV